MECCMLTLVILNEILLLYKMTYCDLHSTYRCRMFRSQMTRDPCGVLSHSQASTSLAELDFTKCSNISGKEYKTI